MKSQREFRINETDLRLAKTEFEINNLFGEIKRLTSLVESYKMKQEKSIKLIYTWLAFSIAIIAASLVMTQMGATFLKAFESISSWITCLFLIFGGLYAAKLTYCIDKFTGYIVSGGWALISTCYIGYVLFDFGSLYPAAAAIGFNAGASAQTLVLISVTRLLYKMIKNNG